MFLLYVPASNTRPQESHQFESVRECVELGDNIAEDRIYSVVRIRDSRLMLLSNLSGKQRYF